MTGSGALTSSLTPFDILSVSYRVGPYEFPYLITLTEQNRPAFVLLFKKEQFVPDCPPHGFLYGLESPQAHDFLYSLPCLWREPDRNPGILWGIRHWFLLLRCGLRAICLYVSARRKTTR